MKKLLSILLTFLFFSNSVLSETITEPFDLWCTSYKKEIHEFNDNTTVENTSEDYQIKITDQI